jgi:hypothetical protein
MVSFCIIVYELFVFNIEQVSTGNNPFLDWPGVIKVNIG